MSSRRSPLEGRPCRAEGPCLGSAAAIWRFPRRARLALLAVLVLAVTTLAGCAGDPSDVAARGTDQVTAAPKDAPNIVVIMTDDLSVDEMRYLPRTRHLLGDRGATFSRFAAPQPLCCPARAQFLTGQYAQNNGVRHNQGPFGGYQAFHPETALPVWLHKGGYQTAMVGKYLNGYASVVDKATRDQEAGWDHWDPTVRGVYDYKGFVQDDNGKLRSPRRYHTDYVAKRSRHLITDMSDDRRPFFLWSSFVAPHGVCKASEEAGSCINPPRASRRYAGDHAGQRGITTDLPSFNERDVSDKPPYIRHLDPVSARKVRRLEAARADSLTSVDDAVVGMLRSLRRSGELDDTYVFFTSDNGYLMGQHRFVGKILAYDESVRVPLIVRGPGIPAGARDDQSAAMIDLAPTFAAIAGATPQVEVDGRPIVLRRKDRPDHRTLLVQAGTDNLVRFPGGWQFRGVRTARYTLVRWEYDGFVELYDRQLDPYELVNVADDSRYARARAELTRRLALLAECAGADCETDFGPTPGPDELGRRLHFAKVSVS